MDARSIARHSGLRPRPRYSARPFVLTVIVVFALAAIAWAAGGRHAAPSPRSALSKRDLIVQDEECRLVHFAEDKCAFVRKNCPDEEAGIFSYLTLYYCRFPHAQPVAFIILVLWLALLFSTIGIAASDFFCVNLSTIASALGMSESMAGVTFLAFGNGSPDVFSTFAAMSTNSASLAIGELIGAACFITAVVAGSMALVRPFKVARRSFIRDVGFFIVAASFSMVFIWDGKLHLWESATMVGFYIFYVCFVMVWHWWLGRRKARRQRAATMRSHYILPGGEEEEISQEYHDEDDGPTTAGAGTPGISTEDFNALERAGGESSMEEDDNEDVRERWLGELQGNMRLSRPPMGNRRNTHTPIRPSLVGALEFRAVLTSLQKSRNIQSIPISLRRYSDDPTFTTAQQQDFISTTSDPAARPPYHIVPVESDESPGVTRPGAAIQQHMGNRMRAVSTNDMDNAQVDPETFRPGAIPSIDVGPASPEADQQPILDRPLSWSPTHSPHTSRSASPAPRRAANASLDMLTIPEAGSLPPSRQGTLSPVSPGARPHPRLEIPGVTSPTVPFPAYTDYPFSAHSSSRAPSFRLPSPSASPESLFHHHDLLERRDSPKVPRWWPSSVLPPHYVLIRTLFPTLTNWNDKSLWEKLLGVVAAPSVFLLTMTLPVMENQKDDDSAEGDIDTLSLPGPHTPGDGSLNLHQRSMVSDIEPETSPGQTGSAPKNGSLIRPSGHGGNHSRGQTPQIAITSEEDLMQSPEQLPANPPSSSEPKSWNRWLIIVQAFTAPFFIVLIVWANTDLEHPRALLRPTLYSLIFSLVLLAILLTTTSPTRPPRWRIVFCFLGFAVAVAWISSIANEVVGVLKTLGVILNMSDAILGLTIFAVGNSLGDFVADITVARLGFPVMALSACLGGPMLNILLGIGISGCYITIKGGKHRHEKHPDKPLKFKPYHIDVSTTLVISGATLLVTLVSLLIVVPWRRWKMDRTIGWGLVALWTASTLANVIVEVVGLSKNVS